MKAPAASRLWSHRDSVLVHLTVGVLVCLFVLSPALFTPRGFGNDFTNHLWLVWQQGLAISHGGHPTFYLQLPNGIFEPFFGFYGGTLYSVTGAVSALLGNDHAWFVYLLSIFLAVAMAYGGMWWIGRLLGLGRWTAHLPAFIVVTAAYYLTDAYARGAWPELIALSAVPLFVAGGARLLIGPWRAGPVALFVLATVALTGSHNITLLWSAIVIAPVAVLIWLVVGVARPSIRTVAGTLGLTVMAAGINFWFLLFDVRHSKDVPAARHNSEFLSNGEFRHYFYFDNIGNVLDPLRQTPHQSTTAGLTIAAPIGAIVLAIVLAGLAGHRRGGATGALRALWWVMLATTAVLVVLLVMPASWWITLGSPFTEIQFPYRLAGWLMIAIGVLLAISLRFARGLGGGRRKLALALGTLLILATVAQASAQLYSSPRLDGKLNHDLHPRTFAFESGPQAPPTSWYDPYSYAEDALPLVEPGSVRKVILPIPSQGQTRYEATVALPPGKGPIATNIAAPLFAVDVTGDLPVVGRNKEGMLVLGSPEPGQTQARVAIVADAGSAQTAAVVLSLLCLLGSLGLIGYLASRPTPARP